MKKKLIWAGCLALIATLILLSLPLDKKSSTEDFCEKHQLLEKDCPWCTPSLIEELGWCNGCDRPEAICYTCNPKLKAGFIAEGDWCKEHQVPESQCKICNPPKPKTAKKNLPKDKKSSTEDFCEKHQLLEKDCPWCTPSLIEELGWCNGCDRPEAICYKCNPKLKAGFIAEGDWCKEHQVPESQCEICNPQKSKTTKKNLPEDKKSSTEDFCEKHQLLEKDCPWCTPSLIEDLGWCNGCDRPEAICYTCNPKLKAGFIAEGDWCKEHQVPESQCKICNPPKPKTPKKDQLSQQPRLLKPPAENCNNDKLEVKIQSTNIVKAAGIKTLEVQLQPISRSLSRHAEIKYNRKKKAKLSPPIPGIVQDIPIDLGQQVNRGDLLMIINSSKVSQAKSNYLLTLSSLDFWKKTIDREELLFAKNAISNKRIQESRSKYREAQLNLFQSKSILQNYGLNEGQIKKIKKKRDTSPFLPFTAPFTGTILTITAGIGETVAPNNPIIEIADTKSVWCMIHLFDKDIPWVKMGQEVLFVPLNINSQKFQGSITWISSAIDLKKRSFTARVELSNTDGILKSGMFGKVAITLHSDQGILAPKEALQWDGCCNIVFVKKDHVTFKPRKVTIADQWQNQFIVSSGLHPGDQIVTQGSFLLKTEILKGNIGAGCCEEH